MWKSRCSRTLRGLRSIKNGHTHARFTISSPTARRENFCACLCSLGLLLRHRLTEEQKAELAELKAEIQAVKPPPPPEPKLAHPR